MSVLHSTRDADGILHLVLDEPAKRNALTDALRAGLLEALQAAQGDDDTRAILISGASATFCSGGDISAMTGDPAIARRRMGILHAIARLLLAGRKPAVAAVSGNALGAGLSLALCCDQIIADRSARFGATFGRVGLAPDLALGFTLPRRIGEARARYLVLSGDILDAEAAERIGVVDRLVEPPALASAAHACALAMSAHGQEAKGHAKALLTASAGDLDAYLEREMTSYVALLNSREHQAARQAFLDRSRSRG